MWLKILCVVVIASGVLGEDYLLDQLYGPRGRNRVVICIKSLSGRWRRCDGALFNRECAVAHAACLSTAHSDWMTMVRMSAGGNCDDVAAGLKLYSSRKVSFHVMHPWFDLALVAPNMPYNDLEQLPNTTKIMSMLQPHRVYHWMEYYFENIALARDQEFQMLRIARVLKTYHNPIWFILTTMVIPTGLFMLFFMYITFYTGSLQEIPYKKIKYSKKVAQV